MPLLHCRALKTLSNALHRRPPSFKDASGEMCLAVVWSSSYIEDQTGLAAGVEGLSSIFFWLGRRFIEAMAYVARLSDRSASSELSRRAPRILTPPVLLFGARMIHRFPPPENADVLGRALPKIMKCAPVLLDERRATSSGRTRAETTTTSGRRIMDCIRGGYRAA